ncbi:hypothetical protein MKX01_009585 [Papaver californicum]|nr:hypothetical protein MKX01_009585 [Papaver californicum]
MGYKFYIFRVQTKPGFPFLPGEFHNYELLNFSKHLSLPGHNKETDFESLFAYLSKNDKFVNCQGLAYQHEKRVSDLLEQLNQEKQAHEKQVLDLTAKLEEYSGAKGGSVDDEHWMTGHAVPSYVVPFEELDVLNTFPRNTPLRITKAGAQPRRRFSGGVFPIVIVNVEELVPDKENARFGPDIWGLFQNTGTCYAARKPFKSEM